MRSPRSWRQRRGRCAAHIINLAAKAFLFGNDIEAFEVAVEGEGSATADSLRLKIAQAEWRKRGAVGRLHNLVVFVRASAQRREAFRASIAGDMKVDSKWSRSHIHKVERQRLFPRKTYRLTFCFGPCQGGNSLGKARHGRLAEKLRGN